MNNFVIIYFVEKRIQYGGVAQLGEHLPCKQGVRSSTLLVSTILMKFDFLSLITLKTK